MTSNGFPNLWLLVLVVMLGAVSGCADEHPARIDAHEARAAGAGNATAQASSAIESALSGDAIAGAADRIAIPRQWQLPKISQVERAASWEAMLADLPETDQAWLRELNDRYAGALAFSSPEEQQWLVQQGFPMPKEWLAGQRMLDMELENLAKSGNSKAQMLFVDRVASRIALIRASGKGLSTSPEDRKLLSRYSAATQMASVLLRETRSPFAAYLWGQIYRSGSQHTPPEYMASGIMLAQQLGDRRTPDLRNAFLRKYPDMDAGVLMATHSSIQSALDLGKR